MRVLREFESHSFRQNPFIYAGFKVIKLTTRQRTRLKFCAWTRRGTMNPSKRKLAPCESYLVQRPQVRVKGVVCLPPFVLAYLPINHVDLNSSHGFLEDKASFQAYKSSIEGHPYNCRFSVSRRYQRNKLAF